MVDQNTWDRARLWIQKKSNHIVNRPAAKHLYNSAFSLSEEYNQTGRTSDFEKALQAAKEAYNLFPEDHLIMGQLADCFCNRFTITRQEDDFNESKRIFNLILSQNPERGPELDALLHLSLMHASASVYNTKCLDFEESIRLARRAVEKSQVYLIKPLHPFSVRHVYQPLSFKFLSYSYHFRFQDQKNLDDLKEAIQATRQAIKLDQENDRSLRRGLKDYLYEYYTHTGERSSLEEVISLDRQALDSAPTGSLEYIFRLFMLAHHLWDWGNQLPAKQDFSEATKLYSKAAQMVGTVLQPMAKEHSKQSTMLMDLGGDFYEWYRRTGEAKPLAKARRLARQAIEATPLDHRDRVQRLLTYGMYLTRWTDEIGTEAELKDGIEMVRTIEQLAPDGYLNEYGPICRLISILLLFYKDRRVPEYLQHGIRISRRVIDGISKDSHHLAGVIFNLVILLNYRYEETRALADLKDALELAQRGVDMTPLDHPERSHRLNVLALQFQQMALREDKNANMNRAADLSKSIREVEMSPHPREIMRFVYRASFLRAFPPERGRKKYLEEIIDSLRGALALVDRVQERAYCLSEASSSIFDLYHTTGDVKDLDEAIRLRRDHLNLLPVNSWDRKGSMYSLSQYLEKREIDLRHGDNFEEATQLLVQHNAIDEADKLTLQSIGPWRKLIGLHMSRKEWEPAFEAASSLINRLPTLILRYLEPSDKQYLLSFLIGLASDASTSAQRLQKDPVVTLGLLERARGILASSMEEMRRTDVVEFKGSSPEQVEKLINLRSQLDMLSNFEIIPSTVSSFPLIQRDVLVQRAPFDIRYKVGNEMDRTLEEVGRLPEFKAFFSPPTEQELRDAADHGPIVVITINYLDTGCDAIIIQPNKIHTIFLPKLSWDAISNKIDEGQLGRPSVLEWLWDTAMGPILDTLGYTQPVVGDDPWPHVWWIPTGELSMFPLHAAGHHTQEPHNTVLSRVVSSYSTSVRAIIQGRRRRVNSDESPKALLVAMETTPYQSRLPYATEEIKVLKPLCNSINHTISEPARNKKAVLKDLQHCNIFHFAGHGCTVRDDPGKSYLCLEEGSQNPIRVNDLLNLNLFARPPFLAYLSACGTGRVGSRSMVDESLHLISACQLSGFLHVIGTLWEVNDKTCVDVAEIVYKGIRDGGMSNESVAQGLHNALLLLRDQWVSEIKNLKVNRSCMRALRRAQVAHNAGLKDDEGQDGRDILPVDDEDCISPPSWVPYVHFGI